MPELWTTTEDDRQQTVTAKTNDHDLPPPEAISQVASAERSRHLRKHGQSAEVRDLDITPVQLLSVKRLCNYLDDAPTDRVNGAEHDEHGSREQ